MSPPVKLFSLKVRKIGTSLALTIPSEAVKQEVIDENKDVYVLTLIDDSNNRFILVTQDEEKVFRAMWNWGVFYITTARLQKLDNNILFYSKKAIEKAQLSEGDEVVCEVHRKYLRYLKKK